MGNSRARAVYEAQLPDGFRRPQSDSSLETFIRAKYEHKKYMAREWVPPPPAVANWDREIDDEMEAIKRSKKKTVSVGGASAALSSVAETSASRRSASTAANAAPIALAKPAPSPKSTRTAAAAAAAAAAQKTAQTAATVASASSDLLGLSLGPSSSSSTNGSTNGTTSADDLFSNFLSAPPPSAAATTTTAATSTSAAANGASANGKPVGSLAEQEADFFNQVAPTEQEKGKMTRDSILALYGQSTPVGMAAPPAQQQVHPNAGQFGGQFAGMQQQHQQHQQLNNAFAGLGGFGSQMPQQQQQPSFAPNMQPNMFAAFGNNGTAAAQQPHQQFQSQPSFAQFPPMAGGQPAAAFGVFGAAPAMQPTTNGFNGAGAAATSSAATINQKLNSLNLGNVWQ